MSGVSLPVTRPIGRALVIASPSSREMLVALLVRLGFDAGECDDPYTAMLELTRRRLTYRALVLSLSSLYREELTFIATIKRRFPHLEIWLAHTDGRQGTLVESLRLGADGLLDDEGFHRIATPQSSEPVTYQPLRQAMAPVTLPQDQPHANQPGESSPQAADAVSIGEPVLTAEELRALLQDQPAMPPSGGAENST